MTIKKNPWSKFYETTKRPQTSGAVHVQDFYFDLAAGLLAADIVDFGVLIGGGQIVDAFLFTEDLHDAVNVGSPAVITTADVGFLSGTLGALLADDGVSARVLTKEVFDAASLGAADTAIVRMSKVDAVKAVPTVQDRSIGLQVSANIAATPGGRIHLRLFYRQ
jgi:hypothetical protein